MNTSIRTALALAATLVCAAATEQFDVDKGKPAPELVAAGWVGTPVSLADVRGNTVVLTFWNADIPC